MKNNGFTPGLNRLGYFYFWSSPGGCDATIDPIEQSVSLADEHAREVATFVDGVLLVARPESNEKELQKTFERISRKCTALKCPTPPCGTQMRQITSEAYYNKIHLHTHMMDAAHNFLIVEPLTTKVDKEEALASAYDVMACSQMPVLVIFKDYTLVAMNPAEDLEDNGVALEIDTRTPLVVVAPRKLASAGLGARKKPSPAIAIKGPSSPELR